MRISERILFTMQQDPHTGKVSWGGANGYGISFPLRGRNCRFYIRSDTLRSLPQKSRMSAVIRLCFVWNYPFLDTNQNDSRLQNETVLCLRSDADGSRKLSNQSEKCRRLESVPHQPPKGTSTHTHKNKKKEKKGKETRTKGNLYKAHATVAKLEARCQRFTLCQSSASPRTCTGQP